MPSTEDTTLVANTLPATQINTVANLELVNQTGQNGEKSGKLSGVTLPMGTPENKREEQVSDGRALNDDPRESEATTTDALTTKNSTRTERKVKGKRQN